MEKPGGYYDDNLYTAEKWIESEQLYSFNRDFHFMIR